MRDHGKLNAIVVAGDRGKSHPVFGKNKAFLEIAGVPLVARVVSALDAAESVAEIYVVGPKDKLEQTLSADRHGTRLGKPVHIFEQRTNLYKNIWNTFLETIPGYREGKSASDLVKGDAADTVVLVVAADMPLLTGAEVDEFVSKCDMDSYDYVVGITCENVLTHYYPKKGKPGIRLAYLHFSEGNVRQNNMHMVRPFRVGNRYYVQTMYNLRYQKELGNMMRLAWEILRREAGGWGALGNYLLLQTSLLLSRLRLGVLRDMVRRRTHMNSVIECISKLLKTRFSVAYTSLGGATLDVDHGHEYKVIERRFSEWMNYQEQKARALATHTCPERSPAPEAGCAP
jgi:GTP:adenosylcobinamide-phosphate guanylyltransferase